jgi:hypothetical protein
LAPDEGPDPAPAEDDDGLDEAPGGEGGVRVGDLAVLPVPRVRAQVGCGERVGVVLEDRRNVVKVFFPEIDRAFWVDRRDVLSVPEDRLPTSALALRLHRICRALDAVAVEVYDREGDADAFHVFSRGTTLDALNGVKDGLGGDFRRLGLDPGGVRRTRITLVFKNA